MDVKIKEAKQALEDARGRVVAIEAKHERLQADVARMEQEVNAIGQADDIDVGEYAKKSGELEALRTIAPSILGKLQSTKDECRACELALGRALARSMSGDRDQCVKVMAGYFAKAMDALDQYEEAMERIFREHGVKSERLPVSKDLPEFSHTRFFFVSGRSRRLEKLLKQASRRAA